MELFSKNEDIPRNYTVQFRHRAPSISAMITFAELSVNNVSVQSEILCTK